MDDEMIINPTDSEYSYEDSRSKGKKIGLRQHKSVVNDSNLSIINDDDDLESMFPKQSIMAPSMSDDNEDDEDFFVTTNRPQEIKAKTQTD